MNKFRVRDGFTVRINEKVIHEGGAIVELSEDQVKNHRHKIEAVETEKAASAKKERA